MQNKQWAKVDPSIYTQCFTGMPLIHQNPKRSSSKDHKDHQLIEYTVLPYAIQNVKLPMICFVLVPLTVTALCRFT